MRARRGLAAAAAALVTLALTVTGCAQHGSDSKAGTLSVGQVSNSAAFFPIYIAQQKGYFAQAGVKVGKPTILGTGAKVAAAVKSGGVDVGASVFPDVLNLAGSGTDTKLVTNLVDKYYIDIVVGKDFTGPDAKAPLNDRIKALKGKKIGITGPGSGTEALLIYLFKKVGLDAKTDAELVNLGGTVSAAVGALKTGRVDALSYAQPAAQIVETGKFGTNYISPVRGDVPGLDHVTQGIVFTTKTTLDAKKKEVAAFDQAVVRALKFIHSDPDGTRKLLASYLDAAKPATLDALMPLLQDEMPDKAGFPRASFDASVKFNVATGEVSNPPSYEELVPANLRVG